MSTSTATSYSIENLFTGTNSATSEIRGSAGPLSTIHRNIPALVNARAYRRAMIGKVTDVCGRDPVILGTRISVAIIVDLHYRLGWDIRRILDEYPELSYDQVKAALEYYEEKPTEIDKLLQQEKEIGRG